MKGEEEILKDLVYTFYPKDICYEGDIQVYKRTPEFTKLSNIILNEFYLKDNICLFLNSLKKNIFFSEIKEYTSFSFANSFLFILEFLEDKDKLIRINIEISILVPYYCVYMTENIINRNTYSWVTLPVRNKKIEAKYIEEIGLVSRLVENIFNYKKFPEYLHYRVIDNISFSNIPFGKFTFYNAFFRYDDNIPL